MTIALHSTTASHHLCAGQTVLEKRHQRERKFFDSADWAKQKESGANPVVPLKPADEHAVPHATSKHSPLVGESETAAQAKE